MAPSYAPPTQMTSIDSRKYLMIPRTPNVMRNMTCVVPGTQAEHMNEDPSSEALIRLPNRFRRWI